MKKYDIFWKYDVWKYDIWHMLYVIYPSEQERWCMVLSCCMMEPVPVWRKRFYFFINLCDSYCNTIVYWLFSPNIQPPWGTHQNSPSLCTIDQVHPGPWAKAIPQMGLPLPEAEITQTVLPSMFFMCATGTLSFYSTWTVLTGQGHLDWQIPDCWLSRWLLLNVCPNVWKSQHPLLSM